MLRTIAATLIVASIASAQACPGDGDGSLDVTVDEIIASVGFALDGCPSVCGGTLGTIPRLCSGQASVSNRTGRISFYAADRQADFASACFTVIGSFGSSTITFAEDECSEISSDYGNALFSLTIPGGELAPGVAYLARVYLLDSAGNRSNTLTATYQLATAAQLGFDEDGPLDCPGDTDQSGEVTVDEILAVVDAALNGCPGVPPPACAGREELAICNLRYGRVISGSAFLIHVEFDAVDRVGGDRDLCYSVGSNESNANGYSCDALDADQERGNSHPSATFPVGVKNSERAGRYLKVWVRRPDGGAASNILGGPFECCAP